MAEREPDDRLSDSVEQALDDLRGELREVCGHTNASRCRECDMPITAWAEASDLIRRAERVVKRAYEDGQTRGSLRAHTDVAARVAAIVERGELPRLQGTMLTRLRSERDEARARAECAEKQRDEARADRDRLLDILRRSDR